MNSYDGIVVLESSDIIAVVWRARWGIVVVGSTRWRRAGRWLIACCAFLGSSCVVAPTVAILTFQTNDVELNLWFLKRSMIIIWIHQTAWFISSPHDNPCTEYRQWSFHILLALVSGWFRCQDNSKAVSCPALIAGTLGTHSSRIPVVVRSTSCVASDRNLGYDKGSDYDEYPRGKQRSSNDSHSPHICDLRSLAALVNTYCTPLKGKKCQRESIKTRVCISLRNGRSGPFHRPCRFHTIHNDTATYRRRRTDCRSGKCTSRTSLRISRSWSAPSVGSRIPYRWAPPAVSCWTCVSPSHHDRSDSCRSSHSTGSGNTK